MMCIVIIAQYADCTPCGFGSRQKVRSVVHPRAAILHFDPKFGQLILPMPMNVNFG